MQSLGKVGRILSGSADPPSMSVSREAHKENQSSRQSESPTSAIAESQSNLALSQATSTQRRADDNQSQNSNYSFTMNHKPILQEPDVIASTKLAHSKTTDSVSSLKFFVSKLC